MEGPNTGLNIGIHETRWRALILQPTELKRCLRKVTEMVEKIKGEKMTCYKKVLRILLLKRNMKTIIT